MKLRIANILERELCERALKYTHFELKNTVVNLKANFQSLIKLNYRILFSFFDYIPLSFECTDIKTLLQSREINFLGLLKLDYYCICFLSLLFVRRLFKGSIY